jgi:hypothetical protein
MKLLRATELRADCHPFSLFSPSVAVATGVVAHPIVRLQRKIGNLAVRRLLKSGALQAKLAVSQPGDMYEQAADGVADLVMSEARAPVQRKCTCGGSGSHECAGCRKKQEESLVPSTSVQHQDGGGRKIEEVPSAVDEILSSPGHPLDESTRSFMESRLEHDFSNVRVHSDTQAASSARAVDALAYTVGRHVVFGAGQYAPPTTNGRKLLAHELTHVIQQSAAQVAGTEVTASPMHQEELAIQRRPTSAVSAPVLQREEEDEWSSAGSSASDTASEWIMSDTIGGIEEGGPVVAPEATGVGQEFLPLGAEVTTSDFDGQGETGAEPAGFAGDEAGDLAGYTQCDFLDERISLDAQLALHELNKRGGPARAHAVDMLSAVNAGVIQGIFKADEQKPALMARRHGISWFELIPAGQDALVFEEESPPMMVFRPGIASDRSALATALESAWTSSNVSAGSIPRKPPSGRTCEQITLSREPTTGSSAAVGCRAFVVYSKTGTVVNPCPSNRCGAGVSFPILDVVMFGAACPSLGGATLHEDVTSNGGCPVDGGVLTADITLDAEGKVPPAANDIYGTCVPKETATRLVPLECTNQLTQKLTVAGVPAQTRLIDVIWRSSIDFSLPSPFVRCDVSALPRDNP